MNAPRLLAIGALFALGCSSAGGSSGDNGSGDIAFHAEAPVLPDFKYDTGLQPSSGPAQLELTFTSAGSIVVDAAALSGGDGKLQGKPGAGTLKLDMHVKLAGRLKVDAGTTKYDGDLPGVKGVDIPITGSSPFDTLRLDGPHAQVAADVPETKLPDIPLGAVPGHLSLTVAPGTRITTTYASSCVDIRDHKATLRGQTSVSGKIVLHAALVLDIPLFKKSIQLPPISIDIPASTKALDSAEVSTGLADQMQGTCGGMLPSSNGGDGSAADLDSGHPQPPGSGGNDGGVSTDGGKDAAPTMCTLTDQLTFSVAACKACVAASCCEVIDACIDKSSDCNALSRCELGCRAPDGGVDAGLDAGGCRQDCATMHPASVSMYDAWTTCLADRCHTECQ